MADANVTLRQLADVFRRAADRGAVAKVVEAALKDCEPIAVRGMRECFATRTAPDGSPWPPLKHPRPGEKELGSPLMDTMRLMASTQAQASGNTLEIGTNLIQAAVHNYGAVIAPVNAKYLCFPFTLEAKAAKSPRNMTGLKFIINTKKGTGVIVDASGDVQFLMTSHPVTIPARQFVGWSPKTIGLIERVVADAFSEYLAYGQGHMFDPGVA